MTVCVCGMHVCMYMYMYVVCMYVCMCMYVYVCMYVNTHIVTYPTCIHLISMYKGGDSVSNPIIHKMSDSPLDHTSIIVQLTIGGSANIGKLLRTGVRGQRERERERERGEGGIHFNSSKPS